MLGHWDKNDHTPLHVSSYKGDFKSSRLFTSLGADAQSAANSEDPLKVAKDKYTRDVLQTLTDAAQTANPKDLQYLVNCGEDIDAKASIIGQAPIHRVVLSTMDAHQKETTLE